MLINLETVRTLSHSEAVQVRRWVARRAGWTWLLIPVLLALVPSAIWGDVRLAAVACQAAFVCPPPGSLSIAAISLVMLIGVPWTGRSRRRREVRTGDPIHEITGVFHARMGPDAPFDLIGDLPVYFVNDRARQRLSDGQVVTVEALLGATGLVLGVLRCRPRTDADPPAQGTPRWPHRDEWRVR